MGNRGTVKVKNNRYSIDGDLHVIYPNSPIFRDDDKLCGVTNPRDMTYIHSYGGESPFFAGIAEGKLLGTRCDNEKCEDGYKSINVPFRVHCPDCLEKATAIDMTDVANNTARIHTFMICERSGAFNVLDKPIKFINVEFEGVGTILMSYLLNGDPEIGMRVVPIFCTKAPTYTIVDLAFVPEGTPESDLPEGYTLSK